MNTYDEWVIWINTWMTKYLRIDEGQLDESTVFAEKGLDSIGAVTLAGDLEDLLGYEFEDSLLWDYPSVEKLASYLTETEFA